jgi:hypothetical protein
MFKKQFFVCLIAVLGFLQLGTASAITLSFDPSSQNVGVGDPVSVDLRISGLENDILSGFDLEISFDDSILSFQSFTVGPGPTGLDPFGLDFGALSYGFDLGFGTAAVGDLSLETDATLQFFQPDSFVLGTLNFNALSWGTSALDISSFLLAGELALPLDADVQSGSVSVVPVPAAIWLFGTGLIGLVGFSKRRKAVSN